MSPLILIAILVGLVLLFGAPGWTYYRHGPYAAAPSLAVVIGVVLLLWAAGVLRLG